MSKRPAPATGLAHLAGSVAAGSITATQLVTLSLQRIAKDNAALNAVIALDATGALNSSLVRLGEPNWWKYAGEGDPCQWVNGILDNLADFAVK